MYVYLVRYAEEQQDLALLSISTFQRALKVSGSDKASAQLEECPSEKGDNNLLPASLWLGGVKGASQSADSVALENGLCIPTWNLATDRCRV